MGSTFHDELITDKNTKTQRNQKKSCILTLYVCLSPVSTQTCLCGLPLLLPERESGQPRCRQPGLLHIGERLVLCHREPPHCYSFCHHDGRTKGRSHKADEMKCSHLSSTLHYLQVFGGFLVNLNSMLNWLSWIKWLSIFRYGLNVRHEASVIQWNKLAALTERVCLTVSSQAAFILELTDQVFYYKTDSPPWVPSSVSHTRAQARAMARGHWECLRCSFYGETYLQLHKIDYSAWGYWQNEVALLGITLVCMFLAYVQLRRINRYT